MSGATSDVAFSPAVKAQQAKRGSRPGYARLEAKGGWPRAVTPDLAGFIAARDSAYLATASAKGQPYVQHRGGAPGFLKLLDPTTLAFADLEGNRQYITLGNLAENDRAQLFLMDYANQRRVKIWGRARVVEDDAALLDRLAEGGARPARAILFAIEAWDVNCPKHIVPRYSEAEIAPAIAALERRIVDLEAELAACRAAAGADSASG
jgi:predicted pyridoxine 5'-phosphate oxidase superfamily flavin-nucleotide-binding protein